MVVIIIVVIFINEDFLETLLSLSFMLPSDLFNHAFPELMVEWQMESGNYREI